MKIWKISQEDNNGYDTYDSAVVAAKSENIARNINPSNGNPMTEKNWSDQWSEWCDSPEKVTVELIGTAVKGAKEGIICASFNAG